MLINHFNALTLLPPDHRTAKRISVQKSITPRSRYEPGRVLVLVNGYTEYGFHCNLRSPFLTFSEFDRLMKGDRFNQ